MDEIVCLETPQMLAISVWLMDFDSLNSFSWLCNGMVSPPFDYYSCQHHITWQLFLSSPLLQFSFISMLSVKNKTFLHKTLTNGYNGSMLRAIKWNLWGRRVAQCTDFQRATYGGIVAVQHFVNGLLRAAGTRFFSQVKADGRATRKICRHIFVCREGTIFFVNLGGTAETLSLS